jgi:hypothetical protein
MSSRAGGVLLMILGAWLNTQVWWGSGLERLGL